METCGLTGTNMCIVLGEEDTVADAIRVMAIGGVDHILVVGYEGVAGTLSDNDLLKALRLRHSPLQAPRGDPFSMQRLKRLAAEPRRPASA